MLLRTPLESINRIGSLVINFEIYYAKHIPSPVRGNGRKLLNLRMRLLASSGDARTGGGGSRQSRNRDGSSAPAANGNRGRRARRESGLAVRLLDAGGQPMGMGPGSLGDTTEGECGLDSGSLDPKHRRSGLAMDSGSLGMIP